MTQNSIEGFNENGDLNSLDELSIRKKLFYELPVKKQQYFEEYARMIRWGRKYPIRFIQYVFGFDLLDFQKYIIQKTWVANNSAWVISRNGSKTTMLAIYSMARSMLMPHYDIWILSKSGGQAKEMFSKIEQLSNRTIGSFTRATDVFKDEIFKMKHQDDRYMIQLFNASTINTLNSNIENNRGKRSNLNIYDEAGFISKYAFDATSPFLNQDSGFATGVNLELVPEQPNNQTILASSASDCDSFLYHEYKDYFIRMRYGDSRYFACDITADMLFEPTLDGKVFPVSLVNKDQVLRDLATNPEKAQREHYNKFEQDGGIAQVFKKAMIIRNSEMRPPILFNDTGLKKFILAYDPARTADNSVVIIAELKEHQNGGYKAEICNTVLLIDPKLKKKTPKTMPEQINVLKELLINYNGKDAIDYNNIDSFMVDAGTGGGGINYADLLMENWEYTDGSIHYGIIDPVFSKEYVDRFPEAIPLLHLIEPTKYKKLAFDNLKELLAQGRLTFPDEYDGKGLIPILSNNKGKIEETELYLTLDEEVALINTDLAKKELLDIYRKDTPTGYIYHVNEDKVGKVFDDRAYCLALIALRLFELNREHLNKSIKRTIDYSKYIFGSDNSNNRQNLFGTKFTGFN